MQACFPAVLPVKFAPLYRAILQGLQQDIPKYTKDSIQITEIEQGARRGPNWSAVMYAVIESGGKQHRVTEGETLKLEKLEAATGETVNFDKVLMVGEGADVQIGTPFVANGKVTAEVVSHGLGKKIKIIKFRRRKHSRKTQGHRQWFTEVKITGISA